MKGWPRKVFSIMLLLITSFNHADMAVAFGPSHNMPIYLQMLRFPTLSQARAAELELKRGRSFSEVAKRLSLFDEGYIGGIRLDELRAELKEKAAFLKVGEISEIISLDDEFVILKRIPLEEAISHEEPKGSARYEFKLALAYGEMGDEVREEGAYRRAIEKDPQFPEAYNNLGELLRRRAVRLKEKETSSDKWGKEEGWIKVMDEAIIMFKKAIALSPHMAEAHNNLGLAYAAEGLMGLAIMEFEEAVKLNPLAAEMHKNLAAAYYLVGEGKKALEHALKAKELGADVEELLSRLKVKARTREKSR